MTALTRKVLNIHQNKVLKIAILKTQIGSDFVVVTKNNASSAAFL